MLRSAECENLSDSSNDADETSQIECMQFCEWWIGWANGVLWWAESIYEGVYANNDVQCVAYAEHFVFGHFENGNFIVFWMNFLSVTWQGV
jgi:hypothetical protein